MLFKLAKPNARAKYSDKNYHIQTELNDYSKWFRQLSGLHLFSYVPIPTDLLGPCIFCTYRFHVLKILAKFNKIHFIFGIIMNYLHITQAVFENCKTLKNIILEIQKQYNFETVTKAAGFLKWLEFKLLFTLTVFCFLIKSCHM